MTSHAWRVVPVEAVVSLPACSVCNGEIRIGHGWKKPPCEKCGGTGCGDLPRPDYDAMAVELVLRYYECWPDGWAGDDDVRRMKAALRGYFEGE